MVYYYMENHFCLKLNAILKAVKKNFDSKFGARLFCSTGNFKKIWDGQL